MAAVPLTAAATRAVAVMVVNGELRPVTPDEAKAVAFLASAEAALADVPNVTRVENMYDLAYKAAHDVGEAMLAAYGYKTAFGPGAHERLGTFLAAIFDTPPPSEAAAHYGVMRADRNANHYRARPVTPVLLAQVWAAGAGSRCGATMERRPDRTDAAGRHRRPRVYARVPCPGSTSSSMSPSGTCTWLPRPSSHRPT